MAAGQRNNLEPFEDVSYEHRPSWALLRQMDISRPGISKLAYNEAYRRYVEDEFRNFSLTDTPFLEQDRNEYNPALSDMKLSLRQHGYVHPTIYPENQHELMIGDSEFSPDERMGLDMSGTRKFVETRMPRYRQTMTDSSDHARTTPIMTPIEANDLFHKAWAEFKKNARLFKTSIENRMVKAQAFSKRFDGISRYMKPGTDFDDSRNIETHNWERRSLQSKFEPKGELYKSDVEFNDEYKATARKPIDRVPGLRAPRFGVQLGDTMERKFVNRGAERRPVKTLFFVPDGLQDEALNAKPLRFRVIQPKVPRRGDQTTDNIMFDSDDSRPRPVSVQKPHKFVVPQEVLAAHEYDSAGRPGVMDKRGTGISDTSTVDNTFSDSRGSNTGRPRMTMRSKDKTGIIDSSGDNDFGTDYEASTQSKKITGVPKSFDPQKVGGLGLVEY